MDKRTSWNGNSKKIKIPKYMYILILVVSNVNGIYFISQKELLLTLETCCVGGIKQQWNARSFFLVIPPPPSWMNGTPERK